jgi:hypothetical protein
MTNDPHGIVSVRNLSRLLGTSVERLYELAEHIEAHYYHRPQIDKKGRIRHLTVPNDELMALQRRMVTKVLNPLGVSDIAHGGVKGCSPRTNALEHVGQPWVVNLDVREFFPHVRHYIVNRTLRHEYGFGRDVAYLVTRLTTLEAGVPQGAATSTGITNLVMANAIDRPLAVKARVIGVRATRFVDDITLSGTKPQSLVNDTARLLSRKRLPMYRRKARFQAKPKLRITPRSRIQEVTGVTVNCGRASLSRRRRDAVRAAIFQLRDVKDAAKRAEMLTSIRGRIAYVRQFNPGTAKRLQRQLDRR